jgi:DNA-binding transcriptional LysR family regulator
MLKSGEADIALCNLPIKDEALESMKCIDVHDIFVCADKYKDVCSTPRSLEEIMELPLIFLERKSNSRQYVERFLLSKGIRITAEIELGSHDLLLEFARFNFGVACVVEEFSQDYLRNGIVHKVNLIEEIPARSIGFCFLKSVPLSSAAQRLVELVNSKGTMSRQL